MISETLDVFIPLAAPSMNRLASPIWSQHRMESVPEVKLFKARMSELLPKWSAPQQTRLTIHLKFQEPWYYKNQAIRVKDVDNMSKVCVDVLAHRYAFNDCYVWKRIAEKVDNDIIGIQVQITPYAGA